MIAAGADARADDPGRDLGRGVRARPAGATRRRSPSARNASIPGSAPIASAIDTAVLASAVAIVVSGASVTWLADARTRRPCSGRWHCRPPRWRACRSARGADRRPADRGALRGSGARDAAPCRRRRGRRDGDDAVGRGAARAARPSRRAGAARRRTPPICWRRAMSTARTSRPVPAASSCPVRNPHLLAHLDGRAARPRAEHEIVVDDGPADRRRRHGRCGADTTQPTESERLVFSRVLALAERYARHVRLVIVPARDVFDAVVSTVIRLQASDVYVGESATISADAQARLLGEAWERASTPDLQVRLVDLPSQRPLRRLPPRSARARAERRATRSHSSHLARRRQERRPASPSPRRRPGGTDANG